MREVLSGYFCRKDCVSRRVSRVLQWLPGLCAGGYVTTKAHRRPWFLLQGNRVFTRAPRFLEWLRGTRFQCGVIRVL